MNQGIKFSLEDINRYILEHLKDNREVFFFNEIELQVHIVRELEKVFKDGFKIHLEYQLPRGWNKDFDEEYERWGTEKPYFDIVLEHENKFVVIELKYKLKEIKLKPETVLLRFGENAQTKNLILVSNQAAENEGRYDFWKDVKRIEVLSKTFDNVVGGIAIFVTNQANYQKTEGKYKYSNFNLSQSKKGFLYWNVNNRQAIDDVPGGEKLKDNKGKLKDWGRAWEHWVRPNFTLDREYSNLKWIDFDGPLNNNFYYYSVVIPKFPNNINGCE